MPHVFSYAPRPALYRQRRFRRAILAAVAMVILFSAYRWGRPAYERAEMLLAQRQCMNYTAPPDLVVYEEDPLIPSPLIGKTGYQVISAPYPQPAYPHGLAYPPFPTMLKPAGRPPIAVLQAPCLQRFGPMAGMPVQGATLFLHELRTPSGKSRLVIVQRLPTDDGLFEKAFALLPIVMIPGSWNRPPRPATEILRASAWNGRTEEPPTTGLRFYAGQPDPDDPAHFTIEYDLNGGHGIIDGRLSNDGTEVRLHIRTGPASRKSPWSSQAMSADRRQDRKRGAKRGEDASK